MRLLAIAGVLGLTIGAEAGEWRNIGPGGGGWVPSLAVSPVDSRVVYAGCDVGGFYRSVDAGENWVIRNEGLRDYYVEVIIPHPSNRKILYAGTEGGVHRSTDSGETWQLLAQGFPSRQQWSYSAPIGALAIDPRQPNTLYAGIGRPRWHKDGKGAVYRSTNGGEQWERANPNGGGMHPQAIVRTLLIHPSTGALFAATDHGLYRSSDQAKTWQRIGEQLPSETIGRVALCQARPEVMYISLLSPSGQTPRHGGVYRSDDGGQTWTPCNTGLGDRVGRPGEPAEMTSNVDHLAVHPTNPDIVYAGDVSWVTAGVYQTTDGGKTWKNTTGKIGRGWIDEWGPTVMGLAMDPQQPDTLYFSTSGHLFATHDGGITWQPRYTKSMPGPRRAVAPPGGWWSGTGMETTCLNSIAIHPADPQHLYLCYMDVGLIQSLDGGQTFAQTNQGMYHRGNTFAVAFDPDDAQIVYAGTGEWGSNHGDVCKSMDGGLTWRAVGTPETGLPDGQTYHLVVDPRSSKAERRIYVSVAGAGLFCSENAGATWRARSAGLPTTAIRGLALVPGSSDLLVLLAEDKAVSGGLYRSADGGLAWRKLSNANWPDAKALAIAPSDPKRIYVAAREKGTADGKLYPGGVFASGDGGITWSHVLQDRFIQAIAVDPVDPDVLYAGGNDHPFHDDALGTGVTCSRDGGRTWHSLNDPSLTVRKVTTLTLSPGQPARLYAGTGGNGVFVRKLPAE